MNARLDNLVDPILRGELDSAALDSEAAIADWFAQAGEQGVAMLIYHGLRGREKAGLDTHPPAIIDVFAQARRSIALDDALQLRAAAGAVAELSAVDVRTLVLKGTALALSHYPDSYMRPRTDIDIWIADADKDRAFAVLEGLGYRQILPTPGETVSCASQRCATIDGVRQVMDVHWALSSRPAIAQVLSFEQAWRASVALPELAQGARRLSDAHALFHACSHLSGHHAHDARLIWVYDIYLLLNSLSASDEKAFRELMRDKICGRWVGSALARSAELFRAPVPSSISTLGKPGAPPGTWAAHLEDLAAQPGWRARGRHVADVLFPPADYMAGRYLAPNPHPLRLFWFYLRRLVVGISKSMIRNSGDQRWP